MQGKGQEEKGEDEMNLLPQGMVSRECMYEENDRHDGTKLERNNIPVPEGARKKG